jgi:hypothetical protein
MPARLLKYCLRKNKDLKSVRIAITIAVILSGFISVMGAELKVPQETMEFVSKVRSRRGSSWSRLNGVLQHRRSGGVSANMPVYLGLIIQEHRTTGQLILDGREGYLLGQGRGGNASSVIPMQKSTALLDNAGVRASDLTLSFIFDDVTGEEEPATLSGVVKCRVIRFTNAKTGEISKVYISRDHYFPLKAEFFKQGESAPWRTLECDGFDSRNGLYYPSRLRVEGPGWRSRIYFDSSKCEMGLYDVSAPEKVIQQLPSEKK